MALSVHDDVLDGALDLVANNAKELTVCTTPLPATWINAHSSTGQMIVNHALTSGDFTLANSTSTGGGRKYTLAAQNSLSVNEAGTAKFVCLLGATSDQRLLVVTDCSTPYQALTTGNTVNVPAFDHTIEDPTT